jgi:DNA-binding transcriptional regulator YbjK
MPELSPRRRQLMVAATTVVADQGLKGLTHRAVDRQAGLSEGSCSAYYRTRQALQEALAQYVASTAAGDVAALADHMAEELRQRGPDDDRKVELTTKLFLRWLSERDVLLARLELELAAARDPSLAAVLAEWRQRLVGIVGAIMNDRGVTEAEPRAEVLVAALDGVLVTALLRPARARRTFVAASVERLMRGLAEPD